MSKVNVADLTFGVEIETIVPVTSGLRIGRHWSGGIQVPQLPQGWKAEHDSSIQTQSGYVDCEIISPPLKGVEGLRQVITVLRWLKSVGAKVNASCGVHVHVGFEATDGEALARLVRLVSKHEKAIFAQTGTKSREDNVFCRPIKTSGTYESKFKGVKEKDVRQDEFFRERGSNRYFSLNLTNLATGRNPTVEFRAFAGTLNEWKMLGHIRTCLGLVERAMNVTRDVEWAAPMPASLQTKFVGGEGRQAVAWLFWDLAWRNGCVKPFGWLEAADLPSTSEITLKLYQMAEQYDERPASRTRRHRPGINATAVMGNPSEAPAV